MSLQEIYKQYLDHPAAEALAADVSLNYVPTTTALREPATVLKHLRAQHEMVEKKEEKFLNVIEGGNSICVETQTTLHFTNGGGAYLVGLDDNFLGGKTATLPFTHIVTFNEEQKIQQIRLLWDQGCLLKAVDTIGARGRNWPIRDGKDQIKMIASSAAAAPTPPPAERAGRKQSRGTDPHSSLSLFANRPAHIREDSQPNVVAPRESHRPPVRDFEAIAAGRESDLTPERSMSPSKRDRNALKGGAGHHYHESRLFTHDEVSSNPSRGGGIKTDAKKYDHFDFGPPEAASMSTPSKQTSNGGKQWDFADFSTPIHPKMKNPTHNQPKYDFHNNEETPDVNTPVFRPHVPKPRPTNDSHFEIGAAETPQGQKLSSRPATSSSNNSGLYNDNVHGGDDGSYGGQIASERLADGSYPTGKMPLKNITNPSQHSKTFGSQWEMNDGQFETQNENGKPTAKDGGNKGGDKAWNLFDDQDDKREVKQRGINIAGDGAGTRKGGDKNWWEEGW